MLLNSRLGECMCWWTHVCWPHEDREAHSAPPSFLVLSVFSICLLLSWILYNKPVKVSKVSFLSSVNLSRKYSAWGKGCQNSQIWSQHNRSVCGLDTTPPLQLTLFFLNIFIDYAIAVVPFPPLHSTPSCPPPPSHIPPCSSCPWVILISSLASTFPTLFSPCLFSTYHLCYLFSAPFPLLSPSQSPIGNPPCDLHFCGSVSVPVVCLVLFWF